MPLTHPIRDAELLVRSRHWLLLVESDDHPRIRRLPLLRLDLGTLQNKYIGETEKDLRRAMPLAERLSPVVLWIDEIEKAFAGTNGEGEGGGVSLRVLGSFLSSMQDRQGEVFVLATTNDVDRLPTELLCKGRFGKLFSWTSRTRRAVRRSSGSTCAVGGRPLEGLDFDALAAAGEGFSGAELEQVVVSAPYAALDTHAGEVPGKTTARQVSQEFVALT